MLDSTFNCVFCGSSWERKCSCKTMHHDILLLRWKREAHSTSLSTRHLYRVSQNKFHKIGEWKSIKRLVVFFSWNVTLPFQFANQNPLAQPEQLDSTIWWLCRSMTSCWKLISQYTNSNPMSIIRRDEKPHSCTTTQCYCSKGTKQVIIVFYLFKNMHTF